MQWYNEPLGQTLSIKQIRVVSQGIREEAGENKIRGMDVDRGGMTRIGMDTINEERNTTKIDRRKAIIPSRG